MFWVIWIGCSGLVFWLVGFWILFRVPVCRRQASLVDSHPKVSVIIPARNEEHNLPRLLTSLRNQSFGPDEIVVVDDHSQDDTANVVLKSGSKLVTAKPLPPGWLGKPWACHQGAESATGDVFVFLDADTFFEEDGFLKMMETFAAFRGVLSINPYHWMERPYEAFSAFFNVMQMVGMGAFSPGKTEPQGMFGPCLVIKSGDYQKSGGHQAVKNKLLENFSLARFVRDQKIPINLFSGRGVLNVRLYPNGCRELVQGWSKSFAAGAEVTPKGVMRLAILWISGLIVIPVFTLISLLIGSQVQAAVGGVFYFFFVIQLFFHFRRLGRFPMWTALAYPVPLAFWLGVFFRAGYQMKRRGSTTWKGRDIPNE